MYIEGLLSFLNDVDNWYLARDARLSALSTSSISAEEFVIYEVSNNGTESAKVAYTALSNVLVAMQQPGILVVYLVQGSNQTIRYYYGISIDTTYNLDAQMKSTVLRQAASVFEAMYAGNFPKNTLRRLSKDEKSILMGAAYQYSSAGILEGVPGLFNSDPTSNGANNVQVAMSQDDFLLISLAKPIGVKQNNMLCCNVDEVCTQLQPLANRTENRVLTDSKNNSFNVNAGRFCSNSTARGNSEVRREYRFTDPDDTIASPVTSTTPIETGNKGRQQTTQNQARVNNELREAIFEGEVQRISSSTNAVNDDLNEEEAFEAASIASQPPMTRRQNRRQPFGRRNARRNQVAAMQLPAPSGTRIIRRVPQGTGIASEFLGGNVPLVDGDFIINDAERQVSLTNTNTHQRTNSNTVATTTSNSETRTKTCVTNTSDRNAKGWFVYNEELLYKRLDFGKAHGLYLYSTGVFANNSATLIKLAASLRYTYNELAYNRIPVLLTPINNRDCRVASFSNFQIPEYTFTSGCTCFSMEERIMRSSFSQLLSDTVAYGGNWISSKELGSILAVPQGNGSSTPTIIK